MTRFWLQILHKHGSYGLLLSFLLLSVFVHAQTFTNSSGGRIPAVGSSVYFYLPVPSLPAAQLDSSYGLLTVCFDITHPRVSNLGISIAAPDGTQIDLIDGAGGNGANFTGTCFNMSDSVTAFSGFAPFTGGFYPRHNIGEMNNGQSGIGTWKLIIQNLVAGDSGVLNNWSLTFGAHAPVPVSNAFGPCNQYNAAGCGCADSTQNNCWLVPDMFVGQEWFTDTIHRKEFHDSITVSNSVANIGYGPMEIIGTGLWFCGDSPVAGPGLCPGGGYAKQLVKQRIYVKSSNNYFYYVDSSVGTMSFHSELGHTHLHVDNWTQNTLRIRGPEADPSKWPIVGLGIKNSMNLYDHIHCDNVFKACDYNDTIYQISTLRNAGLGLGYNSGSASVQGISVGYADIYEYLLPFGQAIYFDSVCNGDYVLMVQYDPIHRFIDMRPENNITWFVTTLTKQTPNCCKTSFDIDTISYSSGLFRFIDRSRAMPAQWSWNFGDGDTSTEQFPFHQYTSGGYHTVTLSTSTAQGCTGTDTLRILIPQNVGISALADKELSIYVFPNPSSGSFIINCEGDMIHDVYLSVYDILGQQVDFTSEMLNSELNSRSYAISITEPGTYILKVRSGTNTYYRKLIKQ